MVYSIAVTTPINSALVSPSNSSHSLSVNHPPPQYAFVNHNSKPAALSPRSLNFPIP